MLGGSLGKPQLNACTQYGTVSESHGGLYRGIDQMGLSLGGGTQPPLAPKSPWAFPPLHSRLDLQGVPHDSLMLFASCGLGGARWRWQ